MGEVFQPGQVGKKFRQQVRIKYCRIVDRNIKPSTQKTDGVQNDGVLPVGAHCVLLAQLKCSGHGQNQVRNVFGQKTQVSKLFRHCLTTGANGIDSAKTVMSDWAVMQFLAWQTIFNQKFSCFSVKPKDPTKYLLDM